MTVSEARLVTEEEFLELPETLERIELVDGEVIVSPSPSFWHQEVLARLVFELRQWAACQSTPITVGQAPLDIHFGANRILQPDAFVIFAKLEPEQATPLAVVPDLCIEVLSRNRSYDRLAKRILYAEAGVKEYWIVDLLGSVEQWTEALTQREQLQSHLTSTLLPGFALDLDRLFAP